MAQTAPLDLIEMTVPPEWLDYNGHMNIAHYTSAIDKAVDAFLDLHDVGEDYVNEASASLFMIQQHFHYRREILAGETFRITAQMLGLDEKRVHLFFSIIAPENGALYATCEALIMHVDMKSRRATPIPDDKYGLLADLVTAHQSLPLPELAGRPIGVSDAPDKGQMPGQRKIA